MLKLILPVCRAYDESRVLVVCDKDNEASRRTIIKNGGKLENEVAEDPGSGECGIIQRYWIDLTPIVEGEQECRMCSCTTMTSCSAAESPPLN